jgi:mono/diheme cytochrome c family protein
MKFNMVCAATVGLMVVVTAKAQVPATPAVSPEAVAALVAVNKDVVLNGDVVKGEATYKLYCALCHGDTGAGDGVGAAAIEPKPRKFNDKAIMDSISDAQMVTVIKEGGSAVGKSMFMVSWKAILNDEQVKDVGTYIRTLAK